jgi:hypothetical protein
MAAPRSMKSNSTTSGEKSAMAAADSPAVPGIGSR